MSRILSLIALIFVVACKKDVPPTPPTSTVSISNSISLLVANEGNFQFGNASLSVINSETNEVANQVFESTNNRKLGDVFQSLAIHQNHIYAVINNSQKIEVIEPKNFTSVGTISGLSSPRYFQAVSNAKAYLSDIYSDFIYIIDLNQFTVLDSISLPGWTEKMEFIYGEVYLTNIDKPYLYVLNAKTDQVTDSILISKGGSEITQDKFGHLWVLCNETLAGESGSTLYEIDPVTKNLLKTLSFSASSNPSALCINGNKDTLYYLDEGVYALPTNSNKLLANPIIEQGNKTFYGLGIHPETGHILVTDAVDYVQRGTVEEYSPNGELIQQYQVGIIPSELLFY